MMRRHLYNVQSISYDVQISIFDLLHPNIIANIYEYNAQTYFYHVQLSLYDVQMFSFDVQTYLDA